MRRLTITAQPSKTTLVSAPAGPWCSTQSSEQSLWILVQNWYQPIVLGSHFALRSSIRKPIFYMWEKFCVVVLHGVTTVVDGVTGAANDLAQYPIWQKFLKNNFLETLQNTLLTKSVLPLSCLWRSGTLKVLNNTKLVLIGPKIGMKFPMLIKYIFPWKKLFGNSLTSWRHLGWRRTTVSIVEDSNAELFSQLSKIGCLH